MKTTLTLIALFALLGLACCLSLDEPCSRAETVLRLKARGCTLEEVITELNAITDSDCEEIEAFYNLNN